MSHAVGIGNVFIQPLAVQPVVLGFLVMGQDIDWGQSQTGREPLELRHRLTGFLRLDVDDACHIHAACADAHDGAMEIVQDVPQTDLPEEGVLGGNMAAAEHHEITVGDHTVGPVDRAAVQNLIAAERDSGCRESSGGDGCKGTGSCMILGIRGNEDYIGMGRQASPDPVNKAVCIA